MTPLKRIILASNIRKNNVRVPFYISPSRDNVVIDVKCKGLGGRAQPPLNKYIMHYIAGYILLPTFYDALPRNWYDIRRSRYVRAESRHRAPTSSDAMDPVNPFLGDVGFQYAERKLAALYADVMSATRSLDSLLEVGAGKQNSLQHILAHALWRTLIYVIEEDEKLTLNQQVSDAQTDDYLCVVMT